MKTLSKAILLAAVIGLLPVTPVSAKGTTDSIATADETAENGTDESAEEISDKTSDEDKIHISYSTYKHLLDMTEKFLHRVDEALSRRRPDIVCASAAPDMKAKKNAVDATPEEIEMLYRITEAEAGEGTIDQKKNVVSCVLARVASDGFPNNIEAVIFEKDQFTPVWDGWYYKVKVTDETRQAVDEVLESGRLHDYLFFCSYGCKSSYFDKKNLVEKPYMDGLHRYYTK